MAQGVSSTAAQLKERKTALCPPPPNKTRQSRHVLRHSLGGESQGAPQRCQACVLEQHLSTPYLESAWSLHSAAPAVTSSC